MERLGRDEMLLQIAEVVAQRGTCSRAQVGAVIAREGRVLSTGYNGAPAGMPHCNHSCTCSAHRRSLIRDMLDEHLPECPASPTGCEIAVHAELNAIAYAARYGIPTDRASMYCVYSPCPNCTFAIINAGITQLFYRREYRRTEGIDKLQSAGVSCLQL